MDIGVAASAWRQLRRPGAHPMDCGGANRAMALIAQRIDIGHIQEPRILRTVRSVATKAPLGLDRGMLKDKRSACLRMALGADRILIGCGLEVVISKRAMRIVAIGALDQALVDLVVKGHIKARFDIGVALEAKGRLADFE